MVFDFFPQENKIFKHINSNKLSFIKPNEEEKEYDHVSSTTGQVLDIMIYDPSGETEHTEEGDNNNQKYGDGLTNKRKISASFTPIQNFLTMEKQDIENAKKRNMDILTVDISRKLNGK